MNLIVDQGNSRAKLATYLDGKIIEKKIIDGQVAINDVESMGEYTQAIVSTVGEKLSEVIDFLQSRVPTTLLNHQTKLPFTSNYATPETLGVDRLANAAGGMVWSTAKHILVIDAGTCITFDFINDGTYEGGAISPGLSMRFKALNNFTANLPLVATDDFELIGRSTESAIASGVNRGVVAEIDGICAQYKADYPDLEVVVTGGDIIYLSKHLKNINFVAPNLTIDGLDKILDCS